MKANTSANHQHKTVKIHNQITGVPLALLCGVILLYRFSMNTMSTLENAKASLKVLRSKVIYVSELVLFTQGDHILCSISLYLK